MELYLHCHIRLHDVHRDTFIFTFTRVTFRYVKFGVWLTPYIKQLHLTPVWRSLQMTVNGCLNWTYVIAFWRSKDVGELCKALAMKIKQCAVPPHITIAFATYLPTSAKKIQFAHVRETAQNGSFFRVITNTSTVTWHTLPQCQRCTRFACVKDDDTTLQFVVNCGQIQLNYEKRFEQIHIILRQGK